MSKRISASLGLISMLTALACSSSGSSDEATKSKSVGSLSSALVADGGVDAGDAGDVNDAGVDAAP